MPDLLDRITITAGIRSGQPCVRGLRVTVGDILGWLAADMSFDEILADYPYLQRDDIRAALAWGALREQRTRHADPTPPVQTLLPIP